MLDAGEVFVRLGSRFSNSGFSRWERAKSVVDAKAKREVKASLGAEFDERGFRRYERELAKVKREAATQAAFKAHLGADYDGRAFAAYERDSRRARSSSIGFAQATRSAEGGLLSFASRIPVVKWGAIAGGAAWAATEVTSLVSALGPLIGVLGAVPGAVLLAGQAIGGLLVSTRGVGDAIKESFKAQDSAGKSAISTAKQANSTAKATAQAKQQVEDASRGRTRAERDETRAQEDLTKAVGEGKRELEDMAFAAQRSSLDQRQSALTLKKARAELLRLESDPTATSGEIEQARIDLEDAKLVRKQSKVEARRSRSDNRDAQRGGVKGTERYKTAKEAVQSASEGAADAERSLTRAQQDAADASKDAALAMQGQAEQAGSLHQALDKLPPSAQHFVKTILGLKPAFNEVREAGADELFPRLERGISGAMRNLPVFKGLVAGSAREFGVLGENAGKMLGSKEWGRDLQAQGKQNEQVMREQGKTLLYLADASQHVMRAAEPLTNWLSHSAMLWAKNRDEQAKSGRESGKLTDFFEHTVRVGKSVGHILESLGKTIFNIGKASNDSAGGGDRLLKSLESGTKAMEKWTGSAKGQNEIRNYFDAVRGVTNDVGKAIGAIVSRYRELRKEGKSAGEALAMVMGEQLGKATELAAENVGKHAPDIAEGLVRGFLAANVWGKILIGSWLLNKLGGGLLIKAVGGRVGGQVADSISTGITTRLGAGYATGGITGALGNLFRGRAGKAAAEQAGADAGGGFISRMTARLRSGNLSKAFDMRRMAGQGFAQSAAGAAGDYATGLAKGLGRKASTVKAAVGRMLTSASANVQTSAAGQVASEFVSTVTGGLRKRAGQVREVIRRRLLGGAAAGAAGEAAGAAVGGEAAGGIMGGLRKQAGRVRDVVKRLLFNGGMSTVATNAGDAIGGKMIGGVGSTMEKDAAKGKGGRLGGAMGRVGRVMGPILAAAIVVGLGIELSKQLEKSKLARDIRDKLTGTRTSENDPSLRLRNDQDGSHVSGKYWRTPKFKPSNRAPIGGWTGGLVTEGGIRGYAEGGEVLDPRDTVPARLAPGEFVMRRSAVQRAGVAAMAALNKGKAMVRQAAAPVARAVAPAVGKGIGIGDAVEADRKKLAAPLRGIQGDLSKSARDSRSQGKKIGGGVSDELVKAGRDSTKETKRLGKSIRDELGDTQKDSSKTAKKLAGDFEEQLEGARKGGVGSIRKARSQIAGHLDGIAKDTDASTKKVSSWTSSRFEDAKNSATKKAGTLRNNVASSLGSMNSAVYGGMGYVVSATNSALRTFDEKAVKFDVARPKKLAEGGFSGVVGDWGRAGQDKHLAMLGEGEAVVNRHQQGPINYALNQVFGMDLPSLFEQVKTPHFMASGGMVSKVAAGVAQRLAGGGYVQGAIPPTNPATRRFASEMFGKGFNVTNALRNYGGTYHQAGSAVDFGDSVNNMRKLWSVLFPRRKQFAELFGPTFLTGRLGSAFRNGVPGTITDHEDHIHVAFLGGKLGKFGKGTNSGGAGGSLAPAPEWDEVRTPKVGGPKGAARTLARKAVGKVAKAANKFGQDKAGSSAGGGTVLHGDGNVEKVFARTAKRLATSEVAVEALGMAGFAESGMRDLPGGDASSQGALQLLASTAQGLGVSPHDEGGISSLFLLRGFFGKGGANALAKRGLPAHQVAQDTQGSGTGFASHGAANYLPQKANARGWMRRYGLDKLFKGGKRAKKLATGGIVGLAKGGTTRWDRLMATANKVSAKNWRYKWGGGHQNPARFEPFDCSGAVSYLVQQSGYKLPTTVAQNIGSWGLPRGEGRATLFYKGNPDAHTFAKLGGRFWGTSGFARGSGHGAGWFDRVPSRSYLNMFNKVRLPDLDDGGDSTSDPKHPGKKAKKPLPKPTRDDKYANELESGWARGGKRVGSILGDLALTGSPTKWARGGVIRRFANGGMVGAGVLPGGKRLVRDYGGISDKTKASPKARRGVAIPRGIRLMDKKGHRTITHWGDRVRQLAKRVGGMLPSDSGVIESLGNDYDRLERRQNLTEENIVVTPEEPGYDAEAAGVPDGDPYVDRAALKRRVAEMDALLRIRRKVVRVWDAAARNAARARGTIARAIKRVRSEMPTGKAAKTKQGKKVRAKLEEQLKSLMGQSETWKKTSGTIRNERANAWLDFEELRNERNQLEPGAEAERQAGVQEAEEPKDDPDVQAQLAQSKAREGTLREQLGLAAGAFNVFGGSGDIGAGGRTALDAAAGRRSPSMGEGAYGAGLGVVMDPNTGALVGAPGTPMAGQAATIAGAGNPIVIQTLHPGDSRTLSAVADAANRGNGQAGFRGSSTERVGL